MTDTIGIVIILILVVFGVIAAFWLNTISDQLDRIEHNQRACNYDDPDSRDIPEWKE